MGPDAQGEVLGVVLEFLSSHSTMTIATFRQRTPWAAAVYYVNRDFTFYYLSDPGSRHSLDIADNSSVALAVYGDAGDWRNIKGVQVEGRAEMVPNAEEVDAAWRLYLAKFPFVEKWKADLTRALGLDRVLKPFSIEASNLAHRIGSVRFYRVTAERVLYTDNSRGFGHRDEFRPDTLADG